LSAFAACEVAEKSFLQTYVKYLFTKNRILKKGSRFHRKTLPRFFQTGKIKQTFQAVKSVCASLTVFTNLGRLSFLVKGLTFALLFETWSTSWGRQGLDILFF
jgi:hypothetical protein